MPEEFGEIIEGFSVQQAPEEGFGEIIFEDFLEKKPSDVPRHIGRTTSRIAESLVGLPGDILRTAGVGAQTLESGAGKIREKIGLEPLKTGIKKPGFPGSEEIKDFSTKLFGEKVLPQSAGESFIDDIVGDAAVLAVPFKGKIPFFRSIGTAIGANLASKGAEKLGAGEKGQAAAKMGAFFISGLLGKGGLKKYWNKQYSEAENAIPSRAKMEGFKLERKLDNLDRILGEGGVVTPSQTFVQKPLREIKSTIHDGRMKVRDAVAAKRKVNELRSSLFDEVKGKTARKNARTKINEVAGFLDESLKDYGKENPKFYKHFKAGNEAYGGFEQSKRVGSWANQTIKDKLGKGGALIIKSLFSPLVVPGFFGLKAAELGTRVFKNPTTRKFYLELMRDAISENKKGFLRNARKLENQIQHEDPEFFGELIGPTADKNSNN